MIENESIILLSQEISEKLRTFAAYKEYCKCKRKIEIHPDLSKKIKIYKNAQWDYQTKVLNELEISFEEEKNISTFYNELMLNEITRNYILSEKACLDILKEVYEVIGDAMNISILE